MDANVLLSDIYEHFSRIPYPGDERVVPETTGYQLESEEIRELLLGYRWQDLPFKTLDQLRSALFFLTPEGYRYYLPAFMFYSVTDFNRADTIVDEVIQSLTLPDWLDLERIRELGFRHPEMQPFDTAEWEETLQQIAKVYAGEIPERTFFERVSGFDALQCKVIRTFLEYMQDVYGDAFPGGAPQIAIARYWHLF